MTYQTGPSWEQLPDSFHSSYPQDFHNLPPTDFYESDQHLRVVDLEDFDSVIPRQEAPPAPATVEPSHAIVPVISPVEQRSEVQFLTTPPSKSFSEVAIARSIKGDRQWSLISEKENGEHQRYAIKFKQLYRPDEHTMSLTDSVVAADKTGEAQQPSLDIPLTLEAALKVFDGFVETHFPPIRLKNDKLVQTYVRLLYPKI